MDHDHFHNHSHDHAHHDHAHHTHDAQPTLNETKALLSYMIHHNEHHAEELADLLDALPKHAQKKLRLAIGTFESANVELREVLDCLEAHI